MTTQTIIITIAVIFFLIPFVVWTIVRFRDKVLQRFAPWHRLALIVSSAVGFTTFTVLIIVALTVF
ncbi:hypothetical protein [Spiroplasma chrysopicola]|uniref:Transmembrane protein n=1 Tax=Spiroplasma chrysopicola DF-1 TaxID=1276227 RepID=R4U9Y8_9MOLU|nr:hypothetical protein [Spiroplasma chrysopicola]AGM24664.1 hypothetical protein SCHRY_v1c00770 [Spiroplasma chrysopicola DF-1]